MKADGITATRDPLLTLTGLRVPKLAGQIFIVFVGYVIAGKLGQATTNIRSGNIGPVWPAFGVAIAGVLAYGPRVWPGIALSAMLIDFQGPALLFAAIGQTIGTTAGSVMAGAAMRRLPGFQPTLERLRDAIAFIGLALAGALVSGTIGTASLHFAGVAGYTGLFRAWVIYCFGDATGAWLVTPLAFTLPALLAFRSTGRTVGFVALTTAVASLSVLLFVGLPVPAFEARSMAFAVLPFVMWASIGFGVGGASVVLLIIAAIATLTTAFGTGPFVGDTAFVGALRLEIFFSVLALTGLALGAMIAERDAAHALSERANLARRLLEAQEQERQRIARELHDDISQRLSMVAIKLKGSAAVQREVAEIASDVQALSHQLHSSRLELLGVAVAMRNFCAEFAIQQKAVVDFESDNLPSRLRSDISLCLYRVLQEALQNAAKHSGALAFDVRLWASDGEVHLTIADRGKGFDVSAARRERGIGLASMDERLKLVSGRLSIGSRPGAGSTIHAIVPLSA
jgi:signal transduction histidine kinase